MTHSPSGLNPFLQCILAYCLICHATKNFYVVLGWSMTFFILSRHKLVHFGYVWIRSADSLKWQHLIPQFYFKKYFVLGFGPNVDQAVSYTEIVFRVQRRILYLKPCPWKIIKKLAGFFFQFLKHKQTFYEQLWSLYFCPGMLHQYSLVD